MGRSGMGKATVGLAALLLAPGLLAQHRPPPGGGPPPAGGRPPPPRQAPSRPSTTIQLRPMRLNGGRVEGGIRVIGPGRTSPGGGSSSWTSPDRISREGETRGSLPSARGSFAFERLRAALVGERAELAPGAAEPEVSAANEALLEAVVRAERIRQEVLEEVAAREDLAEPFRNSLAGLLQDLEAVFEPEGLVATLGAPEREDEARATIDLYGRWLVRVYQAVTGDRGGEVGVYPLPGYRDVTEWLDEVEKAFGGGVVSAARFEVLLFLERTGLPEALLGDGLMSRSKALYERAQVLLRGDLEGESRTWAGPDVGTPLHQALAALRHRGLGKTYPDTLEEIEAPRMLPPRSESGLPPSLVRVAHGLGEVRVRDLRAEYEAHEMMEDEAHEEFEHRLREGARPTPRDDQLVDALSELDEGAGPSSVPEPAPTSSGGGDSFLVLVAFAFFGVLVVRSQRSAAKVQEELARLRSEVSERDRLRASGTGRYPSMAERPEAGDSVPGWMKALLEVSVGDRYEPKMVLGSGGMGTVIKAHDHRLDRVVAIKIPPPHVAGSENSRERFLREAQALARIGHENIAAVYDVPDIPEGELPVLIMEYLEGKDLLGELRSRGRIEPGVVADWVGQAARGLACAHEAGVLHRDVKPANLMLVEDRKVKVLDFGLAALEDAPTLTQTGALMGSVAYMPPEQLRGEKVFETADQYALGASAYQLLMDELPFRNGDVLRKTPPTISGSRPGDWLAMDSVLARALAPYPEHRFEGILAFAREFEAAAGEIGELPPAA